MYFKYIGLIFFSILLSSCVVTPLYAPAFYKNIEIAAPSSEFEQLITNQLSLALENDGNHTKYKLELKANYHDRYNNANYNHALDKIALYNVSGLLYADLFYNVKNTKGKVILQGHLTNSVSYVKLAQGYANLQAVHDARYQAAMDLAEQLLLKLAAADL